MSALWEHLWASHNLPFLVALLGFVGLGLINLFGFFGGEIFGDADVDVDADADVDVDADFDADADLHIGVFEQFLSLLGIGKVPLMISILIALFVFSCAGYNLQLVALGVSGAPVHPALVSLAALVITLPLLRLGNSVVARLVPKEETSAISAEELLGTTGVVTIGRLTSGSAAEVRVYDKGGHTHYIQAVAENTQDTFSQGESVLVISQRGPVYTVVADPLGEKSGEQHEH